MCQRVTCSDCGKPSFAGCGRHIEAVLGDVPPAARCRCRAPGGDAPGGSPGPARGLQRLLGFLGSGRERRRL